MKKIVSILSSATVFLMGCSNFPTTYENVDGSKTRPLAIVCEPPEAAPGDSVSLSLLCKFKPGSSRTITWTIYYDYGTDLYGNEIFLSQSKRLSTVAGTDTLVKFRLPDSALFYSTLLKNTIKGIDTSLTMADADNMFKTLSLMSPPLTDSMKNMVNNFASQVKIVAHIYGDVDVMVEKLFTIRYTCKLDSLQTNQNPCIRWLKVYTLTGKDMQDPDSIPTHTEKVQYLYDENNPVAPPETITVDVDKSYLFVADSGVLVGDTLIQRYQYFSMKDNVIKQDYEIYHYDWLFTNSDYQSGMKQDSLILMQGQNNGPIAGFLPPVDTRMHHFSLYCVVRDRRMNEMFSSSGVGYREVKGYFSYTQAYIRKHQ
ncbi:MAG: hypothetical protein A2293_12975 [Elusimicrobia bacterium RIFOXYB2_FULL_49_7]|nr:MAG: hypothetical protein A2293_12975 [Elusimicrobia bacterium RIFOXYB2_FULL_49_7]